MRLAIFLPAVAALSACQVSKDEANDTVSVTYNQDVAENAAADVANTAQEVGGAIANDVDEAADGVRAEVNDNAPVDANAQ